MEGLSLTDKIQSSRTAKAAELRYTSVMDGAAPSAISSSGSSFSGTNFTPIIPKPAAQLSRQSSSNALIAGMVELSSAEDSGAHHHHLPYHQSPHQQLSHQQLPAQLQLSPHQQLPAHHQVDIDPVIKELITGQRRITELLAIISDKLDRMDARLSRLESQREHPTVPHTLPAPPSGVLVPPVHLAAVNSSPALSSPVVPPSPVIPPSPVVHATIPLPSITMPQAIPLPQHSPMPSYPAFTSMPSMGQ